jgi:hypothetical protein
LWKSETIGVTPVARAAEREVRNGSAKAEGVSAEVRLAPQELQGAIAEAVDALLPITADEVTTRDIIRRVDEDEEEAD